MIESLGSMSGKDKNAALEASNYAEEIEGLKKIDDYTLSIKLKKPYPQFLYALAMPYSFIVAKEAVEHFGKEFLNHPVGTGPFILPVFEQTNRIVYTKNPTFREKLYPSDGEEGDDKSWTSCRCRKENSFFLIESETVSAVAAGGVLIGCCAVADFAGHGICGAGEIEPVGGVIRSKVMEDRTRHAALEREAVGVRIADGTILIQSIPR